MDKSGLYCVIADRGLGLHNSGRTYLCCHSRKYLEDQQGEQIYLDTHTLEDAWASPTRQEIQTALEQGVEHPSCQACWDDEHAGKQSRRQHFNAMDLDLSPDLDQPQLFDLKMGNTCNMKCRTCNPEVSSQWYREDWELTAGPQENITFAQYLPRWRRIPASYSEDNHGLWTTMREWIPNAVYIDYYGAEPMLIRKNFEVLQHAVDQGRAGHMDLHFSTNGTIWSDEMEHLLSRFRRVYFDLSIDDIGSRCGYIRYPSTWPEVEQNIHRFLASRQRHPNFYFCVCVTINSLNVYYLDEIFDYFASLDLSVNFNLLHLPLHLNIKTLPDGVKQAVSDKLAKYQVPLSASQWHQRYWHDHQQVVMNFLMTALPDQVRHWRDFQYYLRGLDRSRGQQFEQALPEFAGSCAAWLDGVV